MNPVLVVPESMNTPIKQKFDAFHAENPDVWRRFEFHALALARKGVKHYGAKTVYEYLRYTYDLATRSDDGLKLNNNYTAYYARLFKQEHPECADLFSYRRIAGEDDPEIPENIHVI